MAVFAPKMGQLIDSCQRKVDYLRVSVTDRCNLRCKYCMPEEGIKNLEHQDILRYEEIERVIKLAAELGIKKVRLTGGDPLVRKGISQLVKKIKAISGIREVSMTTNAVLLDQLAAELSEAGLDRVNISLDTLDTKKYEMITGFDRLAKVKAGIQAALDYDFKPVKINVVILKEFNDDELFDFIELTKDNPLHVRFIELMAFNDDFTAGYLSSKDLQKMIAKEIDLKPTEIKSGNGPARYFTFKQSQGSLGFISPISNHFCSECNRLRLTASGKLRACLCSDKEIDLRADIKADNQEAIKRKFIAAIKQKPDRHHLEAAGNDALSSMAQIGG